MPNPLNFAIDKGPARAFNKDDTPTRREWFCDENREAGQEGLEHLQVLKELLAVKAPKGAFLHPVLIAGL